MDPKTDIFYDVTEIKEVAENKIENIDVTTSLFTTSTPNRKIINNNSETSYINNKLLDLHNKVFDSNFAPSSTIPDYNQKGGEIMSSTDTIMLPINSDFSSSISSYYNEYGIGDIEDIEDDDSDSRSSSPTNSSEDSDEPVKRQTQPKKKKKKYVLRKNSKKKSSKKQPKKSGKK